jgi:long-chain acyl-CoA synthetase
MEITRIFDLLPRYRQQFRPKDDVLAGKEEGKWIKYNIRQYQEYADNISFALIRLGIRKGDRIATISSNRPEWNFVDMGILQTGAVHVPIYTTIRESDFRYILSHAEVKLIFISGRDIYRKIEHILPGLPSLIGVYSFTSCDGARPFSELVGLGRDHPASKILKDIKASVQTGDLATLIYTSGTTGTPKGVMLSHRNIISDILAVAPIFPLDETCRCLSYLPLSHIYERTAIYVFLYLGMSIYYAENLGTIAADIREVKPQVLSTVPRLVEKFYDRILDKGSKLKGMKRILFDRAVKLGLRYEIGQGRSRLYRLQLKLLDPLVYKKWREAFGGNMRAVVSGGAALQPRLEKVFSAAGIPTLEGYGMTETSPVIAVQTCERKGRIFGTVGPPVVGVGVKISHDGEILCKGPIVMMGYYREPELTREAIDAEGWFHTGDLGLLEPDGNLRITGRKKALFKTAMGKYISPEHIENTFAESPFIDSMMVVGENRKFAAALIVPDFHNLKLWCREQNITYTTDAEMVKHPAVKKQFQQVVGEYNKLFGTYEQVMKYELMEAEWTVQSGELSPSLKMKRVFICEKYGKIIEKMFTGSFS